MNRLTTLVLVAAALFFSVDIFTDYQDVLAGVGDEVTHFILELVIFIATLVALSHEIISNHNTKRALREQEARVANLSKGLTEQITQQFEQWQLSRSEAEIAWLIVKGFSFSEIATLREVKEKTVRQQATSIYQKSGVGSRAELTAFFLEDFLSFKR